MITMWTTGYLKFFNQSSETLAGRSSGANWPLPDGEGQPDRAAASLDLPRPQARVGPLQRVRPHHQGMDSFVKLI